MLTLEGAPKLVVVKALEVSFEKSSTSVMEISVSCWREMMVDVTRNIDDVVIGAEHRS